MFLRTLLACWAETSAISVNGSGPASTTHQRVVDGHCNMDFIFKESYLHAALRNSVTKVNGNGPYLARRVEKFKRILTIKLFLITLLICYVENSIISFSGIYTYSENQVKSV